MPLHEAHYQHWDGVHEGIWMRRWVIAKNGLTACLRTRLLKTVVVACWMTALIMTAFLFFLGQLLVPDSMVANSVTQMNSNLQTFFEMLTGWLRQHPELSVSTTQNVLFYFYSVYVMPMSIFALGMALPMLITRDLASSAIVIYSSKAVSRADYLIGKFGTAFGLLTLTWLGPVCAAWFLSNLLAPDWTFFWHARVPLFHILLFGLPSMVILSLLALGVSAFSSREKATPALWFTWWAVGLVIQPIAVQTIPFLQHISFGYNLRQIALAVFQLGDNLRTAQTGIPIFGDMLKNLRPETRAAIENPRLAGAILALAIMVAVAGSIVRKRVKPE